MQDRPDYTTPTKEITMDESKSKTNELVRMINQWGIDRNITVEGGATVLAQMSKMQEEFAEFLQTYDLALQEATKQGIYTVQEEYDLAEACYVKLTVEIKEQMKDDFGDMLVCLIQAMRLAGTDMDTCLTKAWNDIKDRKGTMVAGKFVKESPDTE